jgi:hypothetical protein
VSEVRVLAGVYPRVSPPSKPFKQGFASPKDKLDQTPDLGGLVVDRFFGVPPESKLSADVHTVPVAT